MKADWSHIDRFRNTKIPALSDHRPGDHFGVFMVPCGNAMMRCIADDGCNSEALPDEAGWEHVSVSVLDHKGVRVPTWKEMCFVKDLFWDAEECVVQYHPPHSEYVNHHPHTLHLWRFLNAAFPLPPHRLVGPKAS
jgi:hypothetical protein